MESESVSESGRIYRNSSGIFCFVCVHCGNYFTNIDETLQHIETHFSDGTIVVADETSTNENKPAGYGDSLEFISIATDDIAPDNMKVEHEAKRDDSCIENWFERNSKDSLISSTDSQKKSISCSYCSESFPNQLYLVLHSEIHHPNQPIEGVQTNEIQCERCLMDFDTHAKLEEHLSEHHTMEVTIDLKVDDASLLCNPNECVECKFCRRTFRARHLLKRHLQRSTCKDEFCIPIQVGEFPFYCDMCGSGFPHKFRLIHHMSQRHTGKENKCRYCNQRYVLEKSLRKHETHECFQRPDIEEDEIRKVVSKKVVSSDNTRDNVKKTWGGYREPKNIQGPKMFNCEFCSKGKDNRTYECA